MWRLAILLLFFLVAIIMGTISVVVSLGARVNALSRQVRWLRYQQRHLKK